MISKIGVCIALLIPVISLSQSASKRNVFDLEFVIDHVSTNTFAWPPLGNQWVQIKKGTKVPIGTLIKVPKNGKVRLIIPKELQDPTIQSNKNTITFSGIQYFRVDDLLVRKVKMSPIYLSTVPDKVQKVEDIDSVKTFWEDSWNKVLAILDPEAQDASKILDNQKSVTEGMSVSDDLIEKFPISTFVSYDLGKKGASVNAKWPNDPSVDIYDVYIWASDHMSDSPFNSVRTNFTTEHLYDNGEFKIKIMSRDRKKQSNTATIIIDTKDEETLTKRLNSKEKIKFFSPKDNQVIFTGKKTVEVDFVFDTNDFYSQLKPTYYIVIKDNKNRLINHTRIEEPGFSFPLEEGIYSWAITTSGLPPEDLNQTKTLTPWKSIQIKSLNQKNPMNLSIREFRKILNSKKNSNIKFDEYKN